MPSNTLALLNCSVRLVFKRRGFADKADDSADGTGAVVKKRYVLRVFVK